MMDEITQEARLLIGVVFKERREWLGVTQQQLADKSGLGVATISRFERGAGINLTQMLVICHHLRLCPYFANVPEGVPIVHRMKAQSQISKS